MKNILILALVMLLASFRGVLAAPEEPFLLGPPDSGGGAVIVDIDFELHDVNEIDDGTETFEFAGYMTLRWKDPRQAFDPVAAGVNEKIFQGNFQFNEVSPGWYPQIVLVNETGLFQMTGVILRVQPDGTSTLIQTLTAAAESEMNMYRFPFDRHRLEAIFQVFGFDKDEVVLRGPPADSSPLGAEGLVFSVPQWSILGSSQLVRDSLDGTSSEYVLALDMKRKYFYVVRLVVIPLVLIVLLSFSVFWMDRSSLGDRINVSFIGILTGVAYLIVTSDHLPRISYITLIHGFLNLSFLTMCATMVVNLTIGAVDKKGNVALGDRIDRRCRWAFPLVYFGLLLIMVWVAFAFL